MIKVKTQTRFMVLFTSGSLLTWGISRCSARHLPQVFIYYLPLTINFLCLYRDFMMTEYMFFARKAERWRKDMASLWGSLNICPCLIYLELPCHSPGQLLSISSLKIWGDVQEPCNHMAYLLVCTGDTLEAWNYGISLVFIGSNQVWVPFMEEAVKTLSAYISSRPDWLYALEQLYEGSSHTPLPKDKHLGILPQGKVEESSYGQLSQLKVCQLLSAGP